MVLKRSFVVGRRGESVQRFSVLGALCFLLLCLSSTYGLAEERHPISLKEALALGQSQGQGVQEADLKEQQAQARYKSIEAKWWPKITADAKVLYWNDASKLSILDKPLDLSAVPPPILEMLGPVLVPFGKISEGLVLREQFTALVGVQLVQPLSPLFQVYEAGELAKLGIDLAKEETRAQELSLSYDIVDSYLKLVYAEEMEDVARQAVETIAVHLELAKRYVEAGFISKDSIMEAELEGLKAEQDLLLAQKGRRLSSMKLAQAIGLDLSSALGASDRPSLDVQPIVLDDLKAYQATAKSQRNELKRLHLSSEANRRKAQIAKLDYVPQIALIARYDYAHGIHMQPTHQAFIGLGMEWKIWDGLESYHKAREAELAQRADQAKIGDVEALISLELGKRYLDLESAIQACKLAEKAAALAQERHRIVSSQFAQGEAVSADVLSAHTKHAAAKASYVKAQVDVMDAQAALSLSLGQRPGDLF